MSKFVKAKVTGGYQVIALDQITSVSLSASGGNAAVRTADGQALNIPNAVAQKIVERLAPIDLDAEAPPPEGFPVQFLGKGGAGGMHITGGQ